MLCSGTRQALPHRAQQSRELLPFCQKHYRGSLLRLPLPSSIVLALSPKQTLPLPLGEEQGMLIRKAVMDIGYKMHLLSHQLWQPGLPTSGLRACGSLGRTCGGAGTVTVVRDTFVLPTLCTKHRTSITSSAQTAAREGGRPASQPAGTSSTHSEVHVTNKSGE